MKQAIYDALGEILYEQRIIDKNADIHGLALLSASGAGVMDSLTAMRFISAVEQRFNVDILSDLNLDCLETTDSLAEYISASQPVTSYAILAEPGRVTIGRHAVIDCDGLPEGLLNDAGEIRALVHALAVSIDATVLKEAYHTFIPAGVTGFAIVSASHIALHTWPEYGYMGVDVFSCRELDTEKLCGLITGRYAGAHCRLRLLDRVAEVK